MDTTKSSDLPDDVSALKAIIASQSARIVHLEHNVEVFRRLAFGPKSERRTSEPASTVEGTQELLFHGELLAEAERIADKHGVKGTIESKPAKAPVKKKGGRRKKFPPHLPVVRSTFELPESERTCSCGHPLHELREDVRRELERIEISIVHEIACKVYGCRKCEAGPRTASGPDRVIEKGILGNGFLSHVIMDRFQNHMPYYRLEKKYASEGLDLSRSVLQRSMAKLGDLFEPIWKQLRKDVLASPVIHTDDTPVTIARSKNGSSKKGRTWVYLAPDGNHFYDFTDSWSRDGPATVLRDYAGFIQADAYPGYDQMFLPDGATEVGCWAHLRRKFIDAESSDPNLAKEAISTIRKLYAVEKTAAEFDADARRELRQAHAKPVVEAFQVWLDLAEAQVLPKSPMMNAIRYAKNQWDALAHYVDDGRLAIDNNPAERALRPFAVGRKNWLFFQRDSGGRTASILASLLQTAKAIDLDIRAYFRDLMTRISTCSDVTMLTPHGWKKHFADEVASRQQRAIATITSAP